MKRALGVVLVIVAVVVGVRAANRSGDGPERGDRARPAEGVALDAQRRLGAPVVVAGVTVWPVHADPAAIVDLGEFVSLVAAQAAGTVTIQEVGGIAPPGDVDELPRDRDKGPPGQARRDPEGDRYEPPRYARPRQVLISNGGGRRILVLAGTVLRGGFQDRMVAQDLVLPPRSAVVVDVFGIERRWSSMRAEELTEGAFVAPAVMAPTRPRYYAQYEYDQPGVWYEVAASNAEAGQKPTSGTLFATLDDPDALERRTEVEQAVRARFEQARSQGALGPVVGFAYAARSSLSAVRVFAHPRYLASQWELCLATIAVEADLAAREAQLPTAPASADRIRALVEALAPATSEERDASEAEDLSTLPNRNLYRRVDMTGNARCRVQDQRGEWVTLSEDWSSY